METTEQPIERKRYRRDVEGMAYRINELKTLAKHALESNMRFKHQLIQQLAIFAEDSLETISIEMDKNEAEDICLEHIARQHCELIRNYVDEAIIELRQP